MAGKRRERRIPPQPLRAVIFGVQGSGKGTQAELLARRFGVVHIASGDIFRREIARRTVLGRRAARYLAAGPLVPDAVTNAIIGKRLTTPAVRRRGFVLDGYPRNRNQLLYLARVAPITQAIEIVLSDREAVRRITGRLNCLCGRIYHREFQPPKRSGRCDRCGRKLFVRNDDRPDVVRRRIRIYHRQTAPLLRHFRRQGKLLQVDGRPKIPVVFRGVVAHLRHAGITPSRT